jgi:hypothetical protein
VAAAGSVAELHAIITVGRKRWRWWADVEVKPVDSPRDPGIKTSINGVVMHDLYAWSEAAVRAKADRRATALLRERPAIFVPYRYERRLPPEPTRPNDPPPGS